MGIDRLSWTSTRAPNRRQQSDQQPTAPPSGDTGIGGRSICCRGSSNATPITEPTHGGQQYFASRREHHTGGEVLDHTRGLRPGRPECRRHRPDHRCRYWEGHPTSRRAKSELIALLQEVGKLSSRHVFDKESDTMSATPEIPLSCRNPKRQGSSARPASPKAHDVWRRLDASCSLRRAP